MSRFRPLLPRAGGQPPPPIQSVSRKRRGPACEPCRAKRVACDGKRPTCTACTNKRKQCHYATKDNSESRLQALQREHKAFSALLDHLSTAPAVTAQAILYELRNSSDPLLVLRHYNSGQLLQNPSETGAILSTVPHIYSETELRLQVKHPLAYPALNLSYKSIMSKRTLVDSPKVFVAEDSGPDTPAPGVPGTTEVSAAAEVDSSDCHRDQEQARAPTETKSTCFDALNSHLRISYWTSVAVTNEYAAGAISLYLETDHPMLRVFDSEAFLNDLIHMRNGHCSAFLINSLLAFASQAYCKADPTAAAKSVEFEKEARMLWRADCRDSVPNLAGLTLLYISMSNNGNGSQGAVQYILEAGEMVKRMNMFGAQNTVTALCSHLPTDEARYAFTQAAWGLFNAYNLCVHHWVTPPLNSALAIPIPDRPDQVNFDANQCRFMRSSSGLDPSDEAYMFLCRLCRVDSEILLILRDQSDARPPPLAFTFSKYELLLNLMDSLPESVRHTSTAPPAVLFFHMTFHRCVMDLVRPYIVHGQMRRPSLRHPLFDTPDAIFRASTQQLKGLLVEYTAFPDFALGLMWHPTLLYTASGVLENPSSPDWRFFFLLCIHCYSALYESYPFAESAIQSLLGLAINFASISAAEAENILSVTLHKKKRLRHMKGLERGKEVKNLPMSESEKRATKELLEKFQELSLFEQFTEDVLYGSKVQRGFESGSGSRT